MTEFQLPVGGGPAVKQLGAQPAFHAQAWTPTGAIAETQPRFLPASDTALLTSGRLHLTGIWLPADRVITSATYLSAGTAAITPTHQWFALYTSSLVLLRQTSDDTSAAWAGSTYKTLNFTSQVTPPYTGLYYLGVMVEAATPPSLRCTTMASGVASQTPMLNGYTNAALTATAPNPSAALNLQTGLPYGYVS